MRSVAPIRTVKILNIIAAAGLSVFGIAVLVLPEMPLQIIGRALGIISILTGIFRLAGYFVKDLYRLAFQHDLQIGIVFTIFGAMILIDPCGSIYILFGAAVIIDGLFQATTAYEAKKFGIKLWLLLFVSAIADCLIGVALVLCLSLSIRTLGILLGVTAIAEGLSKLAVIFTTVKIVRHQQSDRADKYDNTDFQEVNK